MATPASRIFVLYIDAPAATATSRPRVLDEIATRGCSGFLILPKPQEALKAVLGVDGDAPNSDDMFAYPKMPVAFFSDSEASRVSAKALGVADVHSISNSSESQAVVAPLVEKLLRVEVPKSKHLVFVHLTDFKSDHWIFSFLQGLLKSEDAASSDDCFISILQTAQRPHSTDASAAAHPLRPRQSYERHHGKYPSPGTSTPSPRLLFSSFHYDRTRRDEAVEFTEDAVETHGAYGAMDARIFMKEMAFRLGFAPKYGA